LIRSYYFSAQPYRCVSLTREGKQQADKIRARNSLLIVFLQDTLGVSAGNAKKDACKLEHTLSDETFKKICILMKKFGESNYFYIKGD
jgi:Mn-dependent DtxR family transcriptional regulator